MFTVYSRLSQDMSVSPHNPPVKVAGRDLGTIPHYRRGSENLVNYSELSR